MNTPTNRIATSDPDLPAAEADPVDPFVFDETSPYIQRLLALGIPRERLVEVDNSYRREEPSA